jgi:hypothetical protein
MLKLLCVALALTGTCLAGTITFIHTGTGSGTIGSVSFTNASFTITETSNTSNIVTFTDGLSLDDTSASILISGVGDFTFITGTRTYVNNVFGTVGFSRAGITGVDLYNGPSNSVFDIWNLATSIGPISGSTTLLQWGAPFTPVLTSGGILIFDNAGTEGTFQAILGAGVPEPASWLLLAAGLCGVGWLRLRRHSG